jgi:hypothetical protein
MVVEKIGAVEWDGHALVGWVTINGTPIKVTADRDTIHRHAPGFGDALTWEIRNHASEIFDKLKPFFRATHA